MLVAEALVRRAAIRNKMGELAKRAEECAQVNVEEKPPEDPADLLTEWINLSHELEAHIVEINAANSRIEITTPGGSRITLGHALIERNRLKQEADLKRKVAQAAIERDRYRRDEIRRMPTVNVKQLRVEADELSEKARKLDVVIQRANWANELSDI